MGGLRVGYGLGAREHTLVDVVAAHHTWQQETRTLMGVLVSPADPSYGWPDGDKIHSASELGWMIHGSVNVQFDAAVSDDEVRERLINLAGFVAAKLGQTRVYLTFAGEDIILQAEGEATPSGD